MQLARLDASDVPSLAMMVRYRAGMVLASRQNRRVK